MRVFAEIGSCREAVRQVQGDGGTVGLVPTMGGLHEGHMSLIRAAGEQCTSTAVTIFVNPTQFGPGEDYAAYPRTLESDLSKCESAGVDIVFAPKAETIYPGNELTSVRVSGITDVLCGPHRPGHFDGVATVVCKLFNILPADRAFFGEKDYQQLIVIEQMVGDLNLPIEIVGCPIVREPDGLALSSRNAYLPPEDRKKASALSEALFAAVKRAAEGERTVCKIVDEISAHILGGCPCQIEYVEVVDARTLGILTVIDRPARICLAVGFGPCRLIDNVAVDVGPHGR